ncbi:hypothetical protein SVI_3966 [Shewanella violacea DSS12]|uniref:Uncharacterized protein n=1 Tax=Shewanella violacea (strain JCM 10179 / CIP 106290 / LMG 19151 / DSS12) TaxID=637905 RepID=D4ZD42_SHEVD|nr:hypothetical protein SVI_3966 [Shewanella violacea DSS12]
MLTGFYFEVAVLHAAQSPKPIYPVALYPFLQRQY